MDLAKRIIDKKIPCLFISPHFDDAALSCATLLEQLSGKTDITIVNVFTKAHAKPYTLSAKVSLQQSKVDDALSLYKKREEEDKRVLSTFQLKITNLGLEDALFRRKKQTNFLGKILPELDHVYPTYRWHIIKHIVSTDYAFEELKKKLAPYKNKKIMIFAPYGLGDHADHRIVRKVCEELFDTIILYSDFPYNIRYNSYGQPFKNGETYRIKPDNKKKTALLKGYQTQFGGLFPLGTVPAHQEVYFSNKQL